MPNSGFFVSPLHIKEFGIKLNHKVAEAVRNHCLFQQFLTTFQLVIYIVNIYMKCPYCREEVSWLAVICPHCRSDFENPKRKANSQDYEDLVTNGHKISWGNSTKHLCTKCEKEIDKYATNCPYCKKKVKNPTPRPPPEPPSGPDYLEILIRFVVITMLSLPLVAIPAVFFNLQGDWFLWLCPIAGIIGTKMKIL